MSVHHYPLISFQAVSKTYGDDPLDYKSLVLKNVHLDIYPGEFVIIFGASGSGKSTLLNLMAGLEFPTAGKILVRRRNITKLNSAELAKYHRLKMGMVFQSFNLIKSLKVWENVALPQTANGVRYNVRKHRALHLLKLFNIDRYADRRPNEISGGEQQRVAISRALINNPAFLLVDEPTGNLDSESAREVMNIFKGLHEHGQHTIVLVTHNPDYLAYASRIVYVQDGMVVKQETNAPQAVAQQDMPVSTESLQQLAAYKEQPAEYAPSEVPAASVPATPTTASNPAVLQAPTEPVPAPSAPVNVPISVAKQEPVKTQPEVVSVEAAPKEEKPAAPELPEQEEEALKEAIPHSWPLKVPPILPHAHAKTGEHS